MKHFFTIILLTVTVSLTAQNKLINNNFENGVIDSLWQISPANAFVASTISPLNGSFSAKDATTGTAISIASQPINISPEAGEMTWQFQLGIGNFSPSSSNNFVYFLMSDTSLLSSTQNGYAIGVNQASPYDDNLKFYKYTNGTITEVFASSSSLAILPSSRTGVKVTRSIKGEWVINADLDGGFDKLIKIGSATDKTFSPASYHTGFVFKHSSSRAGMFWIDDILVNTGASTTPQVNIYSSKNTAKEGEEFTITVKTTTNVTNNTTFTISTSGSASNSTDFSGVPSSITIPAGEYSQSFVVKTIPDSETEKPETIIFTVGLNGNAGINLGSQPNKTVYIADFTRVMNYNLLRYPDCKISGKANCTGTEKNGYLKTIIKHVQPDIFGVNEMMSADTNSVNLLLTGALNTDGRTYFKRAEIDHPTASEFSNMLYYNSNKFKLISQSAIIPDGIRELNVYNLKYLDLAVDGKDSIILTVIQCHLKAGSSDPNVSFGDPQNGIDRNTSANAIMDYISKKGTGNYLLMGDMNLYTSSEAAYQTFLNYTPNVSVSFTDPINRPGVWSGDGSFADIHTQATRLSDRGDSGGSGGLDDRFDFILTSNKIFNGEKGIKYHTNSYKVVGNDGKHFNKDINDPNIVNQAVPTDVADALYNNSDHLPVIADFDFLSVKSPLVQDVPQNDVNGATPPAPKPVIVPNGVFEIEEYERVDLSLYPNPNNGSFTLEYTLDESDEFVISVYSLIGELVYQKAINATIGFNSTAVQLPNLANGIYMVQLLSPNKRNYTKIIVE